MTEPLRAMSTGHIPKERRTSDEAFLEEISRRYRDSVRCCFKANFLLD
jgi:hypothetical protein